VVMAGVLAAITLLAAPHVRAFARIGAAAALTAALVAPLAWSVNTTLTAHTGSLPTAGPAVAAGFGGGARGGFGGGRPNFGQGAQGFQPPTGTGTRGGFGGWRPGATTGGTTQGFGGFTRGGGGAGLLGGDVDVASALVTALRSNASDYTWAAATVGSQNAATYQLASGQAVMPLGGFNGSDPSPTLAEFEQYVSEGRIHYFIGGGGTGRSNGGSSASSAIATWVESHFESTTIGGVTVYDLSSGSTTQGA